MGLLINNHAIVIKEGYHNLLQYNNFNVLQPPAHPVCSPPPHPVDHVYLLLVGGFVITMFISSAMAK